jgi:hypothetical protein
MANFCDNRIKISGSTEEINKLWEDVNSVGILSALRPEPDNLKEHEDYDWRIENWGTGWELDSDDLCLIDNGDGTSCIEGDFDTNWSPPIEAYIAFNEADNGCEVEGWYFELGCDFCGLYNLKEGHLHCNNVSSELELPEAERSEALRRIEYEFGDWFTVAIKAQDDGSWYHEAE